MTFNEFKTDQEHFGKIETPEQLTMCEKQYQTYLSMRESDDFFEPLEGATDSDWLTTYSRYQHPTFNFNQIAKDQILFLIQPSFEPECLVIIERSEDCYSVVHVFQEENYLSKNYGAATETKYKKGNLRKSIGEQIYMLMERSVTAARQKTAKYVVLDGTVYTISMMIGNQRVNVFKHSPDADSKTGRIIDLLETIIGVTKRNQDTERKIELKLNQILNSVPGDVTGK